MSVILVAAEQAREEADRRRLLAEKSATEARAERDGFKAGCEYRGAVLTEIRKAIPEDFLNAARDGDTAEAVRLFVSWANSTASVCERVEAERDAAREGIVSLDASKRHLVRECERLGRERDAARADAERVRGALGEAADALWRAGNMLSAICETEPTRDRRQAMQRAFDASNAARAALASSTAPEEGTRDDAPMTDEQARAICAEAGLDVEAATARIVAKVASYHPCDGCDEMTDADPDPASGIILCAKCAPSPSPSHPRDENTTKETP